MRAVVTGGGGFLGSKIVEFLQAEGWTVASFSRQDYPELAARGVACHQGDLADAVAVREALRNSDVVFHAAAKAGLWGEYEEYYSTNVVGTRNIIDACLHHGIRKLVFTSTPSVVFDGLDMRNVTESEAPIARKHLSAYAATKAEAEQLVVESNSSKLATVCLRPHIIWGPGDNQLFPRLAERHLAHRLRLIGSGDNLVDTTFVDNAARAHIDAASRLEPGAPPAGRAYFISQGDPRPIRDVINLIFKAADLPPLRKTIPLPMAYCAAWVLENSYRLLGIKSEPAITRFSVLEMGRHHYFDISAARRDLGYEPVVSIDEGMERCRLAFHIKAD
jgi:nucleoside-diphosphate-sugar epimerase